MKLQKFILGLQLALHPHINKEDAMKKNITKILILTMLLSMVLSSMYILTGCGEEKPNPDYVAQETELQISSVDVMAFTNAITIAVYDNKKSKIVLTPDGQATITLCIRPAAINLVNSLLSEMDLNEIGVIGVGLDEFFDVYPAGIFPGFSANDIGGGFELIKAALNLELVGLNFEDPALAELATSLRENRTIPEGFQLPEGEYALNITAPYVIRELESPYTGKYTAVYLGTIQDSGEPYVIMTAQKDDAGIITDLRLHIEFLQLTILATA